MEPSNDEADRAGIRRWMGCCAEEGACWKVGVLASQWGDANREGFSIVLKKGNHTWKEVDVWLQNES